MGPCHLGKAGLCCCSVTKSCPTLCDPMDYNTPGFPVLLSEFAQVYVRCIRDAIQPSHPLPPLLLPPSIFLSIRIISNESVLHIRWPKYWSFSYSNRPSNEYSGLFSSRIAWLDLLAVQESLKSLLQHHNSKASILLHSASGLCIITACAQLNADYRLGLIMILCHLSSICLQ